MNNIISNFDQILSFASKQGLPASKKRGILREYLQSLFITKLYALPKSTRLSFVGGTSLRLLKNLNRFSEDLDFDNLDLSNSQITSLITQVVNSLNRENITTELTSSQKTHKNYFNIKFPKLLFELGITTNPKEKLMIKVDYANFWQGQNIETIMLSKYGLIEQVLTNQIDQLMVQKLTAYSTRKQIQPRDIYDTVWLFAQGARFDHQFAKANKLENILKKAQARLTKEGITTAMKNKLKPFLFEEITVNKLDLFPNVLDRLLNH